MFEIEYKIIPTTFSASVKRKSRQLKYGLVWYSENWVCLTEGRLQDLECKGQASYVWRGVCAV